MAAADQLSHTQTSPPLEKILYETLNEAAILPNTYSYLSNYRLGVNVFCVYGCMVSCVHLAQITSYQCGPIVDIGTVEIESTGVLPW